MNCRICGIELSGENCYTFNSKKISYICKECEKESKKKEYKNNSNIKKESSKKYYYSHLDEKKKYRHQYYLDNKEELIQYQHDYRDKYQEEIKEYWKNYREKNVEFLKEMKKIYWINNRDIILSKNKLYQKSPAGKESDKRKHAKRKQFGFNPINRWFPDSHGHHVNKNDVIHIPEDLHIEIKHSVLKNKNMETINSYAYFFLMQQNINYLKESFI